MEAKESSFTDEYDVTYLRAEWKVNPKIDYISGNLTYYIKAISGDLTDLYFDLSDSMQLNSFNFHGTESFNFDHTNNQIDLHLDQTISPGILDSVTLRYEGVPSKSGFGSFTQSHHNGDSIIYTLSEPYGASDWFPCKNSLTDKIDSVDIIVQMPKECKVGTDGSLVENYFPNDSTRIMHWRGRYPVATYLIGLAVTNYAEFDTVSILSDGDTVKVVEYVYPEDSDFYSTEQGTIVPIIKLFSDFFGDYPFKKEKY